MERHFNNDFERFLKQNADQYRLYPSTKPWKGIYAHFHGRRKWFGLGALLLLLTGSLITVLVINSPKQNVIAEAKPTSNVVEQKNNNSSLNFLDPSSSNRLINKTDISLRENIIAENRTISGLTTLSSVISQNDYAELSNTSINKNYTSITSDNKNWKVSSQPQVLTPILVSLTDEMTDQDSYIQSQSSETRSQTLIPNQKNTVAYLLPWTIESVLNSYKRKNKIGLQFNFTPTVSYRKLSENKEYTRTSLYSYPYNVNDAVTQKPAIGFEIGMTAKYAVSSNIRFKAGLQFNVNRYDIKAYDYPIEPATIALASGSRVDSLRTISTYRNFNGNNPSWLQNLYLQIAMPIGVELKIVGDDKVQFGVAGTIQPLYVLTDKAYLLTTDYKNYTEGSQTPGLIRRWNANTAFETYVSYSTGKLKWQVGPQMRYQILSSFVKKYPIKEHLFDFGLKVGISLNTP